MCFRFDRLYIKRWTTYLEIGLNQGNTFIHYAIGPFKFQKRPEWITKDCRSLIVFFLLTRQGFIKRRQIYMSYYIYIYNWSILLAYVYLYVILYFYRDRRRHTISTLLLGYTHIDIYFCILLPKYYIMLYPSVYIQPNTKFVLSYKWNQICHGPGVSLSNIVFTI